MSPKRLTKEQWAAFHEGKGLHLAPRWYRLCVELIRQDATEEQVRELLERETGGLITIRALADTEGEDGT